MSNFSELIKKRRSTRKFTNEPLTQEEVELIMKAALMSPSSKNGTSWQFILVENKETLEKLSLAKEHGGTFIKDCALAVVVTTDVMTSGAWIEDASIASIYIQLQAEDLGLGSCWVQIRGRKNAEGYDAEGIVHDTLGIPYQLGVLSIIAIGRKKEERPPFDENNLKWEKVHIEKFKKPIQNNITT